MLASRIEILTRYHNDTVKKMGKPTSFLDRCIACATNRFKSFLSEKRMVQVEVEHKVTRKQMKRMRKRLYCEFVSLHELLPSLYCWNTHRPWLVSNNTSIDIGAYHYQYNKSAWLYWYLMTSCSQSFMAYQSILLYSASNIREIKMDLFNL